MPVSVNAAFTSAYKVVPRSANEFVEICPSQLGFFFKAKVPIEADTCNMPLK